MLGIAWPPPVAGAEVSRLVKADVYITGGIASFRHRVTIKSKDSSREVLTVLVGELPGLPVKPEALKVPSGWRGRVRERPRRGGTAWAVEVSCAGQPPAGTAEESCGLRAGEKLVFEFSLPYEAMGLTAEPIFLSFSDGRTGIAGR